MSVVSVAVAVAVTSSPVVRNCHHGRDNVASMAISLLKNESHPFLSQVNHTF